MPRHFGVKMNRGLELPRRDAAGVVHLIRIYPRHLQPCAGGRQ